MIGPKKPLALAVSDRAGSTRCGVPFTGASIAAVAIGLALGFMPRVMEFANHQGLTVPTLLLLGTVLGTLTGALVVLEAWIIESPDPRDASSLVVPVL